jgi:hypothetical protein
MFKRHPYAKGDFGLLMTGIKFKNIVFSEENIYKLLSLPSELVPDIVTVSSSVGVEAEFFGKRVRWLHAPPIRVAPSRADLVEGDPVCVGHSILEGDFWRDLLEPCLAVTGRDGAKVRLPTSTLRMTLRSFWGYNALTTDAFIEAYARAAGRRGVDL